VYRNNPQGTTSSVRSDMLPRYIIKFLWRFEIAHDERYVFKSLDEEQVSDKP